MGCIIRNFMQMPNSDGNCFRHENWTIIDVTQKSTTKTQFKWRQIFWTLWTLFFNSIDWLSYVGYCIALSFRRQSTTEIYDGEIVYNGCRLS